MQSPELAGGAGFTFEASVAAVYLVALLLEGNAPGVESLAVACVALQQRDAGEPLDDIIVDFAGANGGLARLSLQVKTSLTISAAQSNTDFRDVIRDCWLTLNKPNFRKDVDRFGVAVGSISKEKARDIQTIAERARASSTAAEFNARFSGTGSTSQAQRAIMSDVVTLIEQAKGSSLSEDEKHEFFAHFVLIEFDFGHEGNTATPTQLNLLKGAIKTGNQLEAAAAWAEIMRLARDGAGKAAIFARPRLVRAVGKVVQLVALTSLKPDIKKVESLTRQWLVDIKDDVDGIRIERTQVIAKLAAARSSQHRIVQITGQPGSGKSALLRAAVENELAAGPVLLLKSGRIDGTGWSSFATANGLSSVSILNLLVEIGATGIGATGSPTLFIDGIDRIETKHQPVVTDLIKEILNQPELDNWRIVMSLRDTGIEPLRNWLGELLVSGGVETVEVGLLDDNEAAQLAKKNHQFFPLLFADSGIREIVRRPFFANILSQNFSANPSDEIFVPKSEIELVQNWWNRGGYNAHGQDALNRQRAIVEMGQLQAKNLGQEMSLTNLTSSAAVQVNDFVSDGILQHVNPGHTFKFSHDIFFEWAFFEVLVSKGKKWLDEIKARGEPPAVARSVDLLSQATLNDESTWVSMLKQINQPGVRQQWVRKWLLAPLSASNFVQFSSIFSSALEADNNAFLKKALVWFQAERVIPNPYVLSSDQYKPDERLRVADLLGWPSDFSDWERFIVFLLNKNSTLPVALIPDVVTIFEVWQNAFRRSNSPISNRLLEQVSQWLLSIENKETDHEANIFWRDLGQGLRDLRKSLIRLLIQSADVRPDLADVRPDLVEQYLRLIMDKEPKGETRFEEIVIHASILATTHAELLVDLSLKHFIDELPEEKRVRERNQGPWFEQLFGHHDWDALSINDNRSGYFPESPLREPFYSLFKHAPNQALRLLKALSNHAITAWRQLHTLSHEERGKPLPLTLTFPWGVQEFWGRNHEYYWARGSWAPKPLSCAYLALEDWAFKELAAGRSADGLIQLIVEGNQCIAALCAAAAIAMASKAVSETVFPLVTSQRLLMLDRWRCEQDFGNKHTALMGFTRQTDAEHAKAVQAMNERPIRQCNLGRLLVIFFCQGGEEIKNRTKEAILKFKNNPVYLTEEERGNISFNNILANAADQYAEFVDIDNYRLAKLKDEPNKYAIIHTSPMAASHDQQEKVKMAERIIKRNGLWLWAIKFFDDGVLDEAFTPQTALEFAKDLQRKPTLKDSETSDGIQSAGELAAAAAMVLCNRTGMSAQDLTWARLTLNECINTPEQKDAFWSPQSSIPWHPGIFAAHGLAAEIRHATIDKTTVPLLLALVVHPLDDVSKVATVEALKLWDIDPHLSWAALHLALKLCAVPPRKQPEFHNDPYHSIETREKEVTEALKRYKKLSKWDALPSPPPPWVQTPTKKKSLMFWRSKRRDKNESWVPQPIWWRLDYAAEILNHAPVKEILESPARQAYIDFLLKLLEWTIDTNSPHQGRPSDRGSPPHMHGWLMSFGGILGRASAFLPEADVERLFLGPIFKLPNKNCYGFLEHFVEVFTALRLFDAPSVLPQTINLLIYCLEKILRDPGFDETSYRAGDFHDFSLSNLIKSLMFVSLSHADNAARYVNGDWSDIGLIMPIIDRFIRHGGWSSQVMSRFLTLCEGAKKSYPAETFADQILDVLGKPGRNFLAWNSTFLPARIAELVQWFSAREPPMSPDLGQKLLRILDMLVDMGDRRSAALQQSEIFREIQFFNHSN